MKAEFSDSGRRGIVGQTRDDLTFGSRQGIAGGRAVVAENCPSRALTFKICLGPKIYSRLSCVASHDPYNLLLHNFERSLGDFVVVRRWMLCELLKLLGTWIALRTSD